MSSSIHYTRKAITSNIFIREKILKKKKTHFFEGRHILRWRHHRGFPITGFFCWKIKYLVFFSTINETKSQGISLEIQRETNWMGFGCVGRSWADRVDAPHSKTNMQQNPKKREILRKDDPLDFHLNRFEFEVVERWLCVGKGEIVSLCV